MSENVNEHTGDTEHIGKYVNQLSRKIRYACNASIVRSGLELTGEQCRLLGYLCCRADRGENVYQKDIERDFEVKRSSVASILSNMEKGGYIERSIDKNDARIKKVIPTEKGRMVNKDMAEIINGIEAVIAMGMNEEEKQMFLVLIRRAISNVQSSGLLECSETDE